MNKHSLLVRYDKDLRMRMIYPEAVTEITRDVVRVIRKAPGANVVAFTFANESNLHHVIHRELDYFGPLKQPFTWKVYDHDLLPSLKDQLASHGFAPDSEPADVMVLDVRHAPVQTAKPIPADIRRIGTLDGLKDVVDVLDQVWGGDHSWVYQRLGGHLQVPGYLSIYAAYVDHRPAAIAWTYFPRGHFAKLFAGSTIAQYRRQGLYTSLLAERLKEIRQRGYRYAVVEASPMGKAIVEKHGFQHLTTVHDYEWKDN